MKVYEIVDTTSEEMYFTLGFFETLEKARYELISLDEKDTQITESGDYDDSEKIEIREHEMGWHKHGKVKVVLTRHKQYIEETDEYSWVSERDEK